MNTYLFTDPHFRPFSAAGAIMPGSYLQFYDSETTDPTPVYADAALNTSLGTEVTSDGEGEFPVMYMDPEVTYRVQFYDADDVLQWDVDPYTPPRDYPAGTVVMFYGDATARDAAYPPALWQVCDGSNGSPDMRDRFPIGVSATIDVGDTGGTAITVTEEGGDVAAGVSGETILDATNMPVHTHRLYVRTSATERGNTRGFGFANTAGVEGQVIDDAPYGYLDEAPQSGGNKLIEETGEGSPTGHTHTTPAIAAHTHTIPGGGLPPYIGIWFVMRKAA